VNLGRYIVGSTLGTSSVTLTKTGADPTTYDIATGGEATSSAAGTGQPFDYAVQSRTIPVGLSSSTATAGAKTGTITVNNTDLTSNGAGLGSADGNDTITVNATVLAHAKPSLNSNSQATSLTLNFGNMALGTGTATLPFGITDLSNVAGYTAGLDLDSITGSGSTTKLTTNLAAFSALAEGSTNAYTASLDTSANGTYSATYTLATSDENITGAASTGSLTLTITANVMTRQWYTDANGTWSTTGNWLGPVPHSSGDTANFLGAITAARTITLDSNQSAAHVLFESAKSYTISGSSTLTITNGAAAADVTVNQGTQNLSVPIAFTSNTTISVASGATLNMTGGSSIAASTAITKNGAGALVIGGTQSPAAGSSFIANAGTTQFNSDPGNNLALTANSAVNFAAANSGGTAVRNLKSLSIGSGATVALASPANHTNLTALVTSALTIGGATDAWTGKLDIGINDLIINGGNYSTIANQIKTGWNTSGGGYWNGNGIYSSTAASDTKFVTGIGVMKNDSGDGTPLFGSSGLFGLFDGLSPDVSAVLVKYTYYGDANLSGMVDGTDYSFIDGGFNNHLTGWMNGDFNYDGVVDGSDYSYIDGGFNNQGTALNATASNNIATATAEIATTSAVPEPGAMCPFVVSAAALFRRRRRVATR